jgi:hypothetical protein
MKLRTAFEVLSRTSLAHQLETSERVHRLEAVATIAKRLGYAEERKAAEAGVAALVALDRAQLELFTLLDGSPICGHEENGPRFEP